ncbi:CsiV family protein [Psychromonas algarum]|uniref:CsiV family protein n=1 Tax=Psychromonas algarum TaxID=2555643 RepID=UPI001419D19A|nr:CsiV family protein [Psychromonas sp. RZ22]
MNCRYILPLLIAVTCSLNAHAASGRWFEVELLVFKRNVDVKDISEQLDQKNVYLKQRERLEVFKAKQATDCLKDQPCLHEQNPVNITNNEIVKGGHRIQRLDSSHLHFKNQLNKLEKHELFEPLMHVAWRMPVQNKRIALPIHLFAGQNYALDLHKAEIKKQKEREAELAKQTGNKKVAPTLQETPEKAKTDKLDVLAALQKEKTIQDLYEIDGNLLIYVERYLFVDSQLVVRTETEKEVSSKQAVLANTQSQEQKNNDKAQQPNTVEVIDQQPVEQADVETKTVITETLFDQNRRLRSGEIHYFDHPLFGMIIQIRKIP